MNRRHAAVFGTANVSVTERRTSIFRVSLRLLCVHKHLILTRRCLLILFFTDGTLSIMLILICQLYLVINRQTVVRLGRRVEHILVRELHPLDRFNATRFTAVNQTFAIYGIDCIAALVLVRVARVSSNFLTASRIVYLIWEHNPILFLHPSLFNHNWRCHVEQAAVRVLIFLLVEMRPMALPLVQHAVDRLFYVEVSYFLLLIFLSRIVHRSVVGLSFPLDLAFIAGHEIPRQLLNRVLDLSLVHHSSPVFVTIPVLVSTQLADRVEHAGIYAVCIH